MGSGFSRGRGVVGIGSLTVGPFSDEWAGRLNRAEMRDWVDVRARASRWEFLSDLKLAQFCMTSASCFEGAPVPPLLPPLYG